MAAKRAEAADTGDTGLGGFIDVTPGVAVVTAELPVSAVPIASEDNVLGRPGWLTVLRFVPTVEPE